MKGYSFISVEASKLEEYLNLRAREGYAVIGQWPCRKELAIENDRTIETTISFYVNMEREIVAAAPEKPNPFEVARKAIERFGPAGPQTEAEWQEYVAMGGKRP